MFRGHTLYSNAKIVTIATFFATATNDVSCID